MTTFAPPTLPVPDLGPAINPFAGPRPLDGDDTLYGRVREVREIRGLLIAHRILLLYSPSGAGKTSLIEASGGLRGQLQDRGFVVPRVIRVGYQLDQSEDTAGVNCYAASVVKSLASDADIQAIEGGAAEPGTTLEEYLPRLAEAHPDHQLCLIFDQFEELFTLDAADHGDKWAFLQDLGNALEKAEIWALFAMREDFIAELDPFLLALPTELKTRFRLGLLGPNAAEQAALGPCNVAGAPVVFDPEAAKEVVAQLRKVNVERRGEKITADGPSVEPLQLQLVCRRLWAKALEKGTGRISAGDLKEGSVDAALGDYYDEQIAATVDDKKADVSERKLRLWFGKDLITEDGFRKQVRAAPGNGDAVLERLRGAYLVRVDPGRGLDWYELTHDRFVNPIRRSNREFERQWTAKWRRLAFGAVAVLLVGVAAFLASRGDESELSATRVDFPSETTVAVSGVPFERFRFEPAVGDVVEITIRLGADATPEKSELKLFDVTSDGNGEEIGDLLANALLDPSVLDASRYDASSAVLRHTVTSAGSLVVQVAPPDKVPFVLSINKIAAARAVALELDRRVEGSVSFNGDVATHVVTVGAAQQVTIGVDPTGTDREDFDPILSIADPEDDSLVVADSHAGGVPESLAMVLEPGVEYAVAVSGFEGSTGSFAITVDSLDSDDRGNIESADDVSEHLYTAPADGGMWVEVLPLDGFDAIVDVSDDLGLIASLDSGGESESERTIVSMTAGEEYLIEVFGFEDSTGSYLLSYDAVARSPLAVGVTERSEITEPDDAEIFMLEGTSGGFGIIEVAPAAGFDVVLEVLTAVGPFVVDGDGDGGIERLDLLALMAEAGVEADDERLEFLYADGVTSVIVSGFEGSTGEYDVSVASPDR